MALQPIDRIGKIVPAYWQMQPIDLPKWPGGFKAAVSLTFDLDADVGEVWRRWDGRLTTLSEAQYGAGRALERLLRMMEHHKVKSTFFVPGEIVQMYPAEVAAIHQLGHEVGHHGHFHLAIDKVRVAEQRDEILRGLEAIQNLLGFRPRGYRGPGWEMTRYTRELLIAEGFQYDSTCMGDDRPYYLLSDTGRLLELPVHWSLDDWVFFKFSLAERDLMGNPDACLNTWKREVLNAIEEGRHVNITMHPEIIGRGYRAHMLSEFIDWLQSQSVWIATNGQVADLVER